VRRIKVGALTLRVRDGGEVRGPGRTPVVLIHGAASSSLLWLDLLRRLWPERRALAPDLPGHGQSGRWPEAPSVALYRDAVGAVCAHSGVPRAVLVGHSMGALVALACAAAWPDRVAGLILVGAATRLLASSDLRAALDAGRSAELLSQIAWSPATPRAVREQHGRALLSAAESTTRADFAALDGFDAAPLCPSLRTPTLVIAGEDDLLVPVTEARRLAAAISGAQWALLARAGHLIPVEQPDALAGEVRRWLAALP
jgi:pimeloyl-ACP methyl ester carboxylesterase